MSAWIDQRVRSTRTEPAWPSIQPSVPFGS
jgi:hypothetical protein